jgi:dolichol-phosphate mannosyltransferase/undecaprenyl-phosphate 4-deoxy-4-formamido-L-arabinose transferase
MASLGEPFEFVFVEDCGPDRSWSVLRELAEEDDRVLAIQLMRNFGQGSATLCGLAHARGAFVITMDDDLQHPPEELPQLIEALHRDEELDVVLGVPRRKQHALFRRLGSDVINWLNSKFLDKDVSLRFSSFRVLRRSVVDGLLTNRLPYPAIGPMLIAVTPRIANVVVRHDPRKHGRSGYTWVRLLRQTLSNFIGYSMISLRLLALLGTAGIVGSVVLGAYYLIRYLIFGNSVAGYTSLMLVLITLSGFNFFAFAVLGEYLFRVFHLQSTTRQYLVRARVGGASEAGSIEGGPISQARPSMCGPGHARDEPSSTGARRPDSGGIEGPTSPESSRHP